MSFIRCPYDEKIAKLIALRFTYQKKQAVKPNLLLNYSPSASPHPSFFLYIYKHISCFYYYIVYLRKYILPTSSLVLFNFSTYTLPTYLYINTNPATAPTTTAATELDNLAPLLLIVPFPGLPPPPPPPPEIGRASCRERVS